MNNCSEFVLDDVMAITAIRISAYTDIRTMLSPVIPSSDFFPVIDQTAIVVGVMPAISGGQLVPIIHSTGKVKDSESDNVAGRQHTVTVECSVDDRDSDAWSILQTLERTPHHLILTLRDNSRVFVRATQDSYLCQVARGDGKTSVSFKVHNLMGMQLIDSSQ